MEEEDEQYRHNGGDDCSGQYDDERYDSED